MNEDNVESLFGERLRELRLRKGLSQKKMAEEIDISPSLLSAYENPKPGNTKNPTILTAIKIATKYGVSIDWLCGLINEEKTNRITKYSDIYKRLAEISSKTHFKMYVDNENSNAEWASLIFSDKNIIGFIGAWIKAKSLYDDEQIDVNMYTDLLSGLFNRYDEIINVMNLDGLDKINF